MSIRSILYPLEGWLYLSLLGLVCAGIILPKASALIENTRLANEAEALIASHISDLSAPPPPNVYLKYRSYTYQAAGNEEGALDSGSIQAAIIDQVKTNRARLVDLSAPESSRELGNLKTIEFRLEVEGDIKSLLDTVQSLGILAAPILIDTLSIKPVGRFDRPDRRMRMTLELSIWTEVADT